MGTSILSLAATDTLAMSLLAFGFSTYDLMIIGFIALLFFGNRLPSMMRNLGQGVTEFKKGMEGVPHEPATSVKVGDAAPKIDDAHVNT